MATRKLGFQPLTQAIYTRLTTDGLTSGYNTYNFAPKEARFPYITFGPTAGIRSTSFSSRDSEAEDNIITVHVWSEDPGDKECSEMMDNVIQAILGSNLSITAYYAPTMAMLDFSEIFVDIADPSRPIRHGVIRFRFHMVPS